MAETKNGTAKAGDAPAFDVRETDEFKAAMADVHRKALEEAKALFAAEREDGAKGEPASLDILERFARLIAASNAEMADQGTNRKRVAPEILEAQRKSRERMVTLIEKAQSLTGRNRPMYRLKSKAYLGDTFYEPFQRGHRGEVTPSHIYFMSVPNLAMEPVNDAAKEIYAAFVGTMAGVDNSLGGRPDPDALAAKPLWMTKNGAIIAAPTATAREHGMVIEPEPVEAMLVQDTTNPLRPGVVEIVSVDDPRATKIPVLGTIAAPAVRGSTSSHLA